ncbi:MAG: hypothetical protein NUV93_02155, partial [Firmicutes bacterium]|nr:hypothetical protein [Bacillota bacterium]
MIERLLKMAFLIGLAAASVVRKAGVGPYRPGRAKAALSEVAPVELPFVIAYPFAFVVLPLAYVGGTRLSFADLRLPSAIAMALGVAGALALSGGTWLLWRSHADLGKGWSMAAGVR